MCKEMNKGIEKGIEKEMSKENNKEIDKMNMTTAENKKGEIGKGVKYTFQILGVLICAVIALFVATMIFQKGVGAMNTGLSDDQIMSYSGTVGILAAGIVVALIVEKTKCLEDMKSRKKKVGVKMLVAGLASVCFIDILWGSGLGICLNKVFPIDTYIAPNSSMFDHLVAILVAPITEELLFRKGIYGFMRVRTSKVAAVLVSSLMFAAVHGYQIQGATETFLVGIVLALAFEKSGNLWYSVVIHMMLNLFATISNALVHNGISFYAERGGYVIYHWSVLAVAAAIVGVVFYYMRSGKKFVKAA